MYSNEHFNQSGETVWEPSNSWAKRRWHEYQSEILRRYFIMKQPFTCQKYSG